MAQVLFIKIQDLKKNTVIDGNVDVDKLLPYVKIAQEIHIQNFLGTKLYEKIIALITAGTLTTTDNPNYLTLVNKYVQPALIHFAMMDYLPFAAYQVKNAGVFKHISENAESVTKSEVDYLVNKEREFSEYYIRRMIDYLSFNNNLFPEYNQNSNEDVYPDKDNLFNGWVL
jgi:hypothetical protein|tara:strand:+ start:1517 stop:2029 length:513 start_codon:yes stop_codon:yes gene_type:complete